jgi:uncharacterized tellurite resistance protein B-like protein
MKYSLSSEEKASIQRKKRGDQALRLCIVMMVSDRDIHDLEIGRIYELLNKDELFDDIDISDESLIELIGVIQSERAKITLEELVLRYSKISHEETRTNIFNLLDKIMMADGILHEKELETIGILKAIWYR